MDIDACILVFVLLKRYFNLRLWREVCNQRCQRGQGALYQLPLASCDLFPGHPIPRVIGVSQTYGLAGRPVRLEIGSHRVEEEASRSLKCRILPDPLQDLAEDEICKR